MSFSLAPRACALLLSTMLQLDRGRFVLAALLLGGSVSAAFGAPCAGTGTKLCADGAGDCTISVDCSVQSGLILDLGSRKLVVAASKTLTILDQGVLFVTANGVVLQPGAKIVAGGDGTGTQVVVLTSSTDLTLADGSLIDVSSAAGGGNVELYANAGAANVTGVIRGNHGTGRDSDGGTVTIEASGDVSIAGASQAAIDVTGGDRDGGGGIVTVVSDNGKVTIAAPIDAHGGGFDGGDVEFDAGTDVITTAAASIQIEAEGPGGSGGSLDVSANGSITLGGNVVGTPQGDEDNGTGLGGDVDLEAGSGNIAVTAIVDMSGAEPDGDGGTFTAATDGDVTISGKISVSTPGDASGGDVTVAAGGAATVSSPVDSSGPFFGGTADISAGTLAKLTGSGMLKVDGGTLPNGFSGEVSVQGCSVQLDPGTTISALGPGTIAPAASNLIQASSSMIIGGTLKAGALNELDYRDDPGIIHVLPGAVITPKEVRVQIPALPCCGAACATTTTTSTSTTSTTSTAPATTTTTATTPATTSTTIVVVTTTTTTVPTTTSTTTIVVTTTTTTTSSTTTSTTTSSTTAAPTTSTAPETSTTSSTVASTTTSTAPASTTTTVTTASPTTTTQPAPACSGEANGVAGASCWVQQLSTTLQTTSPDELGGARTSKRLGALVRNATQYLDSADRGVKVKANLRRAHRKLKAFEHVVQQAMKRKRGPLDPQIGQLILGAVTGADSEIDVAVASGQ